MPDWTEADFANWYSPAKVRYQSHPGYPSATFPYGWNAVRYGSRRSAGPDSEEIGYADNFRWVTSLINRSGYAPGNKALIVGCGIGATIHRIRMDYPSAKIWGTDTSAYIHTIKDTNAPVGFDTSLILNIDITADDALDQLKPFTGGNGKVNWVICELVTETIPLANRPDWYAKCEALLAPGGKVAHILMTSLPRLDDQNNEYYLPAPALWTIENWIWQTIDDWQLEAPTHYWIDASDTSIFRVPV